MRQRIRRKNFEIKFYENLVQKRPNFVQALVSLGDAYTRRGFYREGLAVDRRLAKLKPRDPIVHYNFACSLALLDNCEEAKNELKEAVILGYDDLHYILKDPDLENLRNQDDFSKFFHEIKKLRVLQGVG